MAILDYSVTAELYSNTFRRQRLHEPTRRNVPLPNPPTRPCNPNLVMLAQTTDIPQSEAAFMLEYVSYSGNELIQAKLKELLMCVKLVLDDDTPGWSVVRKQTREYRDSYSRARQDQQDAEEKYQEEKLAYMREKRDLDAAIIKQMDELAASIEELSEDAELDVWSKLFLKEIQLYESTEAGIDTTRANSLAEKFKMLNLDDQFRVISLTQDSHALWMDKQFDEVYQSIRMEIRRKVPVTLSAEMFLDLFEPDGTVTSHEEAMHRYDCAVIFRNDDADGRAYDLAYEEIQARCDRYEDGYDHIYKYSEDRKRQYHDDDEGYF